MVDDPTVNLLRRLVSINSVNPVLVPGEPGEAEIAQAIAVELSDLGMAVESTEVTQGRPNVVATLAGKSPGRTLMFCGHIDTVGVAGMKTPFEPREQEGRLYGRGAQDMKGGIAAMIGAARALVEKGGLESGKLVVAAVVDEEYASIGAEALVEKWRPDAAVITEPTDLMIGIGHKGFAWVEIVTRGRAAHGSRPREGRDAIFRMGRVLARLEARDHELQARTPHPVLGTASLHASIIKGGRELSVYPDHCSLQTERRTVVGETGEAAVQEVEHILAALREEDAEFEGAARLMFQRSPHQIAADHELPQALAQALARVTGRAEFGGLSFWTDAAILAAAGIPTVIFGPGGAGLHSTEEYVRIDEVLACRDALVELALDYCSEG